MPDSMRTDDIAAPLLPQAASAPIEPTGARKAIGRSFAMCPLRFFSNLHRALRLLRIIAASGRDQDAEHLVEDAAARSSDIVTRLDRLERKHRQEMADLAREIRKALDRSRLELRSVEVAVQGLTESVTGELNRQNQLVQESTGTQQRVVSRLDLTSQTCLDLKTQVAALIEQTAAQQGQLRRYEEGFEWIVVKDLGRRMMRLMDDLDDMSQAADLGDGERERLASVRTQLLFALEASGVEEFAPDTGSLASTQRDRVRVREVKHTEDPAADDAIVDVVRPGFVIYLHEDRPAKLVRPAEVRVFKLNREGTTNG